MFTRIAIGALGLVLIVVVAGAAWLFAQFQGATIDTVGEVEFSRALAVPPLAESEVVDGTRVFDLTLQRGESDFGRDRPTPTWGVNGDYLGPTLRASRGEQVQVNVTNHLGEESTLHWHGMHLPAVMDGGPHQMVADGQTWSPTWQINQPAATLWYHPHPHGETARHVYNGISGLFILDDPDTDGGGVLPSTYGVDDIPLIVQDRRFSGHEFDHGRSLLNNTGILGDHVLVNGTPDPYLEVTSERVRLRILNGSNARIYNFVLDDEREFDVVGSDGGLLPAPVSRSALELSPGERAEIVIAVTPGERVVLRSEPLTSMDNVFAGTRDRLDILELRAADTLTQSPPVPDQLAPEPDLGSGEIAVERSFNLANDAINGESMDMARIDFASEVDTTELWRVRGRDNSPHNFHVHDVQFVVRAIGGEPPPAELAGWKDTVLLIPGVEYELMLRFTDYTDPDMPYMFHCHLLRHEDRGMMGQFVVVAPGEQAGEVPHDHDRDHDH